MKELIKLNILINFLIKMDFLNNYYSLLPDFLNNVLLSFVPTVSYFISVKI